MNWYTVIFVGISVGSSGSGMVLVAFGACLELDWGNQDFHILPRTFIISRILVEDL